MGGLVLVAQHLQLLEIIYPTLFFGDPAGLIVDRVDIAGRGPKRSGRSFTSSDEYGGAFEAAGTITRDGATVLGVSVDAPTICGNA
jgi:hypothetical protein